MYVFDSVVKTYERGRLSVRALDGVSLRIERGEFVAITGPSGSGKSTLLSLLGLLDTPTSGEMRIDGKPVASLSESERTLWRRRRIGFVFQFFNLLPSLTVEQNVSLPLLLDGRSSHESRTSALEWIERVGLKDRADHLPEEMSGGELQRAAMARALVANPDILLADEPTGSLDSASGETVMQILSDLARSDGRTVALITHDLHVAGFASRRISLKDGRIDEGARVAV